MRVQGKFSKAAPTGRAPDGGVAARGAAAGEAAAAVRGSRAEEHAATNERKLADYRTELRAAKQQLISERAEAAACDAVRAGAVPTAGRPLLEVVGRCTLTV